MMKNTLLNIKLLTLVIFISLFSFGCQSNKEAQGGVSMKQTADDFTLNESHCFISLDGDDSNEGSMGKPFRTFKKALEVLTPGMTCYIREGEYEETLNMSGLRGEIGHPITFEAYRGERVFFDGTSTISGKWIKEGDIYRLQLKQPVTQLFVNDKPMTLARWPNVKEWSTEFWKMPHSWRHQGERSVLGIMYDDRPGNASEDKGDEGHKDHHLANDVNVQSLADSGIDFTGAYAVMNIGSWLTWANVVTSHDKDSGHFEYSKDFSGSGYMIQSANRFLKNKVFWKKKRVQGHYYLVGPMALDAEEEWFYEKDKKRLSVIPPKGVVLDTAKIRGKVVDYRVKAKDSHYINFKGINFFGATVHFTDCSNLLIESCKFLYPSYNKLTLGNFVPPEVSGATTFALSFPKEVKSKEDAMKQMVTNHIIRDCVFAYMDGPAFQFRGNGDLIENCLFHNIDFTCLGGGGGGGLSMIDSYNLTFRRNTVHTSGNSEGYRGGYYNTIEYNDIYNMGLLQHDGSAINIGVKQQDGIVVRYNWAHDTDKQGIRFDAVSKTDAHNENNLWYGLHGLSHHNVVWNVSQNQMKGDHHRIYNSIYFDGIKRNLGVINNYRMGGMNYDTVLRNVLSEGIYPIWWGPKEEYPPINASIENCKIGSVRDVLRDPDNLDFRPKLHSEVVGTGTRLDGFTKNSLVDIGAYDSEDEDYWIPGRQLKKASRAIPPNESKSVKESVSLMWLPAYKSSSNYVYVGNRGDAVNRASQVSPEFKGKFENNIYNMEEVQKGNTYYWRIDSLVGGKVVKGETWSFTVSR